MAAAKKSKQTNARATQSRATAASDPRSDGLVNPHRKGSKVWSTWEEANPLPVAPAPPITPEPRLDVDLQQIATRLRAIDDYSTDKWEGLDGLLDNKIEILATAIANRLQPLIAPAPLASMQPAMPAMPTTNTNGNPPESVRSQWNWVDDSVMTSITDLKFDPVNLHKLSPLEDVTHFNLNLEAAGYGGFIVAKDGLVTAITGTAKLDRSLPTFSHWFSAFSVYASIRSAFDHTGQLGPALFMFIHEMNHYQLNFPWPQVLCYFLETFREYEGKPASVWREPFYRAFAKHLHHHVAPMNPTVSGTNRSHKSPPVKRVAPNNLSSNKDSPKKRYSPEERAQQICQLYNLEDKGCKEPCPGGRRHVCLVKECSKRHPLYEHK